MRISASHSIGKTHGLDMDLTELIEDLAVFRYEFLIEATDQDMQGERCAHLRERDLSFALLYKILYN